MKKSGLSFYKIAILLLMAGLMAGMAYWMGHWAEQINPGGIIMYPSAGVEVDSTDDNASAVKETKSASPTLCETSSASPRNAFLFGASMGLLGTGLLYCCLLYTSPSPRDPG